LLTDHRDAAEARAEAAGVVLRRDSYVFSHDTDGVKPWRPDYVSKQFCKLRHEAGLDGHRLHDLRHFMATEMIHAGVPIPIVAARLAHNRASTTMNVYAHAVPGGDRDAAIGLAALLDG
jgi:integrase